jgi:drug/metabolite transporter (DMT)-like permease
MMKEERPKEENYLFDNPRNVNRLLGCFFASLVILLIIDFFVHKHPHFPWEGWVEFYAVYGFVACVALVLAAKYILRSLVKRREDYYD